MTIMYKDLMRQKTISVNLTDLNEGIRSKISELTIAYKSAKAYLHRRNKAYNRSVRNQLHPAHSKKCKHGRQQRTKRRA